MRPWRTLFLSLLFVPLTACLDVDTRILVTSDGSGTLTERIALKGPMAQMMQQMEGEKGGFADREKVEQHAKELGEGVRVVSVKELPESEGVGAIAVFAFDDVTRLKVRQNPVEGRDGMSSGASSGPGAEPAQMKFRFQPGRPAVLTVLLSHSVKDSKSGKGGTDKGRGKGRAGTPDAQADSKGHSKSDPMADKMLAGLKEMLKGMRMAVSVEVDGNIVETNATYRDGNRLTLLELEVDKLLEADPESAVVLSPGADVEAMKKAISKVPGVKVELESEVRIVFTPGTVLASARQPPHVSPGDPGSL